MSAVREALTEASRALRACPLFSSFPDQEIHALLESAWQLSAPAGEILFEEGEAGDFLFVILSGSVRVVSRTAGQCEQVLALLGPGDSVGEMSLLDGEPRSATAIVARPARLIRIDRRSWEAVVARFPGMAHGFLASSVRLVSKRLRAANLRLLELARLGIEARAQIEQMRAQILSLMSDELRTPITVIRSSAHVLRKSTEAVGRPQLFVEMIERQSERLQLLVDDLIALALLQVGSGLQRAIEVDLVELIEESIEQVQPAAAEKGVRLLRVHRGDSLRLVGDRGLLARALRHLLANGVKFSPPAAVVRVETERLADNTALRLTVVDQGLGLPPAARDVLFEPIGPEPLRHDGDGLGIGLSLVKAVALAHGGRLRVESEPGQGSRFMLELPVEPDERGKIEL
jgi:signal transduction histidine kinase